MGCTPPPHPSYQKAKAPWCPTYHCRSLNAPSASYSLFSAAADPLKTAGRSRPFSAPKHGTAPHFPQTSNCLIKSSLMLTCPPGPHFPLLPSPSLFPRHIGLFADPETRHLRPHLRAPAAVPSAGMSARLHPHLQAYTNASVLPTVLLP